MSDDISAIIRLRSYMIEHHTPAGLAMVDDYLYKMYGIDIRGDQA